MTTAASSPAAESTQPQPTAAELVKEGAEIRERVVKDIKRLEEIEAELVKLGAGSYKDESGTKGVLVIQPKAAVKPVEADIPALKKICGSFFNKLFERKVSYKARKDIGSIAAAVLTPAKLAKFLAQVSKPSTPYVKWS